MFGRGYWFVVAAEFIALYLGVRVLGGPLDAPEAGVAWVSLVVGVHFLALAAVFGERYFHWLGGMISLIAGVLPGAVLLGFGWWGVHRTEPTTQQFEPVEHDEFDGVMTITTGE